MSRHPRDRLNRWAPNGALSREKYDALRASADKHNARLNDLFAEQGPPPEDSFPVQFAREMDEREKQAAREEAARQREAAQRARENPLEHTIQDRIRAALEKLGHRVERRGVGRVADQSGRTQFTYGTPGEADLEVYPRKDGRVFASVYIEVKRAGQQAKPHQAAWLEKRRSEGHVAGVAHSVEEAVALVNEALSR